jgi:hypothetical protein
MGLRAALRGCLPAYDAGHFSPIPLPRLRIKQVPLRTPFRKLRAETLLAPLGATDASRSGPPITWPTGPRHFGEASRAIAGSTQQIAFGPEERSLSDRKGCTDRELCADAKGDRSRSRLRPAAELIGHCRSSTASRIETEIRNPRRMHCLYAFPRVRRETCDRTIDVASPRTSPALSRVHMGRADNISTPRTIRAVADRMIWQHDKNACIATSPRNAKLIGSTLKN